MTLEQVTIVSNADWSVSVKKRWISIASLQTDGYWAILDPIQINDSSTLLASLKSLGGETGCILAGFDFPIGLPYEYALKAGATNFLSLLPQLGQNEWGQFYNPAKTADQINIHRPFFPQKPGSTNREQLMNGLGMPFEHLYRLCEVAHKNRRSACPLFWTLGGQQVGKAAISGWKYMLSPAITNPNLKLQVWPFSGPLDELCQPGNLVVAETYPAEFYSHLGISLAKNHRLSKRKTSDRRDNARLLLNWAESLHLDLEEALKHSIESGFGLTSNGEDRFDALVGLFGMLNIILGNHPVGEPSDPRIIDIEGWILGQDQLSKDIINDSFNS
jgi:hypothetical protein